MKPLDDKRLSEIEARLKDAARFERAEVINHDELVYYAGEDVNGSSEWDDLLTFGSDANDGDQEFVLAAWRDLRDAVAEVRRLRLLVLSAGNAMVVNGMGEMGRHYMGLVKTSDPTHTS
jgi:hypothetical protein